MTLIRRAVLAGFVTAALAPGRTVGQPGGRGRRVGIFAQARDTRDDLVQALRAQRTTTIPIAGIDLESDPVAGGFVANLARPGVNVTGIWMDRPELAGEQIQFLREVVPSLQRPGVVWDDRIGQPQFGVLEAAARPAGTRCCPCRCAR